MPSQALPSHAKPQVAHKIHAEPCPATPRLNMPRLVWLVKKPCLAQPCRAEPGLAPPGRKWLLKINLAEPCRALPCRAPPGLYHIAQLGTPTCNKLRSPSSDQSPVCILRTYSAKSRCIFTSPAVIACGVSSIAYTRYGSSVSTTRNANRVFGSQ